MRYAIFSDIHANLEALEAVLARIDEISEQKPIDEIWFLGDLVGYGPNPNECITTLRARTNMIIAGNHDWAAVGKIDLEDFSSAARISAEWTAKQLTEEHREFLINLPDRLEADDCTLVHGSPFGPLWEYLTTEVLAERSFLEFLTRYCFVGHTHVPVIFQQPDTIATVPTHPLFDVDLEQTAKMDFSSTEIDEDDTVEMVALRPLISTTKVAEHAESAYAHPETGQPITEENANKLMEARAEGSEPSLPDSSTQATQNGNTNLEDIDTEDLPGNPSASENQEQGQQATNEPRAESQGEDGEAELSSSTTEEEDPESYETTPEEDIQTAEDRLNSEIEELLELLGLSQSMIEVTNEMVTPPEGEWQAPTGYRAIVNPGGVGQPRDGDPRSAFMIYDTEKGFEFYRVPYELEKTQEKIIKAGLPPYLAVRLAYGR